MKIRLLFSAVLLCLLFISAATNGYAKKKPVPRPKFILVRIPTYTEKIALYDKAKNKQSATEAATDAKEMRKAIIADFNENFTYCPYYFFDDTNAQRVMNKHFIGTLFDREMKLIDSKRINTDDTTYQIAYFGHYLSASDDVSSEYTTGSSVQRLVLVDHKFRRIPDNAPNGRLKGEGLLPVNMSKQRVYKSKLADVYYIRFAKEVSKSMQQYYSGK